ncbi:MAG: galactose-1-epimerase, partial [Bacteroidetes bacterium 4572_117]
RHGNFGDIVLGYDNVDDYITGNPYFGAIVGRYANRISNGQFTLDGRQYQLEKNIGKNHLHGGLKGFNDVIWDAKQIEVDGSMCLEFSYLSKDSEGGYPGNLSVKVTYSLTENNELKIAYSASTDKTTIINLTNHSFFNLEGEDKGSTLNHEVFINADKFTVTDKDSIPTGEIRKVDGSPMDFRKTKTIGKDIRDAYEQLVFANGFDHNWVLNKEKGNMSLAASVREPVLGRFMEVWTDQPGMQFYSCNYLDGSDIGKNNKAYHRHSAFCLETQHFPDSPNHEHFPDTSLSPGENFYSETIYKFGVYM